MLASEAIARAYREASIKAKGEAPDATELEEGLTRLNGFLGSLFGAEIGEVIFDVQVPQTQRATNNPSQAIVLDYPGNLSSFDQLPQNPGFDTTSGDITVPQNVRILWKGTTATTVYLPEYPSDGARIGIADTGSTATLTLNGNGRKIGSASTLVLTSPVTPQELFYRADLGGWIPLTDLTLTDTVPLPSEFDDLIVSGTAIRLTALDQLKPNEGTLFIYERLLKRCKQRYTQRAVTNFGGQNLPQSSQAYDPVGFPTGARGW
jgi:hypothetical protein